MRTNSFKIISIKRKCLHFLFRTNKTLIWRNIKAFRRIPIWCLQKFNIRYSTACMSHYFTRLLEFVVSKRTKRDRIHYSHSSSVYLHTYMCRAIVAIVLIRSQHRREYVIFKWGTFVRRIDKDGRAVRCKRSSYRK